MPWQHQAADLALERTADGNYRYRVVVITVPRQSGKTTLLRAIGLQKMMLNPGRRIFYTAQTGMDARERWADLVEALERSPMRRKVDVKRAAGKERVVLPNGSYFRCFAPTPESLHGYTPHDVMIDEAFAQDEVHGEALMGAIVPAMSTVQDGQLYIVSTAGTKSSVFLRKWVDAARDGQDGVCLIDYGAADGVDAYDPAAWWTFHPAIGYTVRPEALTAAADQLSRAEYERAYANRWTLTESHIIPDELWRPLKSTQKAAPGDALVLSYDVSFDGSVSTILGTFAAEADLFHGVHHTRILERHAGTDWLVESMLTHAKQLKPRAIGAEDGGHARAITDELRRRHLEVTTLTAKDFASAFGRWMNRLEHKLLTHDGTQAFAAAAAAVATRPMGDSVAPSRRHSAGDVSPVIGAVVGSRLLEADGQAAAAPRFYFPGEK